MTRLRDAFSRTGKAAALIPFVTAGFPHLNQTVAILKALAQAGADVIELGVPFSDPMADGPAIQRANEVALANGVTLAGVLAQVSEFRQDNAITPIVLMGYANSFVSYGRTAFVDAAAAAGVDGVIIVDIADNDRVAWQADLAKHNIALVSLIAPTTPLARRQAIIEQAAGFLYFISLRGVTGTAALNVQAILPMLADIRQQSSVPLAVGFGVREPAQAKILAETVDGVVIGSRLVEIAEANIETAADSVAAFVRDVGIAMQR